MNHDPSQQFLEEILKDIDKNNDNQISYTEFSDGLTSLLGLGSADKVSEHTTEYAV